MMAMPLLFLHALALLLGYLLLPVVLRVALMCGWLDHLGDRRMHAHPVPRLGWWPSFPPWPLS